MPSLIDRLRHALAQPFPQPITGDNDFNPAELHPDPVPAAVLVPIVRRSNPGLILTTRTPHLSKHAGQVAFPGGRVDPTDRSHVAAALREAQEEIGLDPRNVDVIGESSPYRTATGYAVSPIVGVLSPDLSFTPNPHEVADLFEVPLDYVLNPANHQSRETLWEGRLRRYWAIPWKQRMIWGATAGMLVNLARRLG